MDRNQKKELVANLAKTFGSTQVVVITRNHGLTVAQVSDLRARMRGAGAAFKVTKNRLARIALDEGLAATYRWYLDHMAAGAPGSGAARAEEPPQ